MRAKEIIKILKKNGWILKRTKGSHLHFKHDYKSALVTVPFHGSKELNFKTLLTIIKSAELPKTEFFNI